MYPLSLILNFLLMQYFVNFHIVVFFTIINAITGIGILIEGTRMKRVYSHVVMGLFFIDLLSVAMECV